MTLQLYGYIDSFANNSRGLLTTQLRIADLLNNYTLNKEVNRDISDHRIPKITKYIDTFDNNIGIYLPSIVLVASGTEPEVNDMKNLFTFKEGYKFIILDGQHRIKALERYVNQESNQKKIDSILNSAVTVQIYFNMSEEQQRKLFIDINSTSKKVSQNLTFKFDKRDPINVIIKELLNHDVNLENKLKITDKTRVSRPSNKSWMSITRLNRYISYLLFNTNKISNKNMKLLEENFFEITEFLTQYFSLLIEILPEDFGNVEKYILGHEALQNALAIVTHEMIVINKDSEILFTPRWKEITELLHLIDWTTNSGIFSTLLIDGANYKQFKDSKHSEVLPLLRLEWEQLLRDWEEEVI